MIVAICLFRHFYLNCQLKTILMKLRDINSKTCILVKFKKYIKGKNKINSLLFTKYNASVSDNINSMVILTEKK